MRHARKLRAAALAACLGLSATACHHDCDGCHQNVVPVFVESEPNDEAFQANYFGVLLPGDHFLIEGHISDDGFDPFDGFAFTAGGPIHVDFQLFIDNVLADLDACLYDPQLGQMVACFQTSNNPEQGGVDATTGGLDFHLVVQSFVGSSTYALEIFVDPLILAASTAEGRTASVRQLRAAPAAAPARLGADPDRFDPYGAGGRSPGRVEIIVTTELDLASGLLLETVTTRRMPATAER